MLEIIVCEDNEILLKNYVRIIEKCIRRYAINAHVVCATNNSYAVENYLRHNSANVFFLDIDLKLSESGFALAGKIRESSRNAYLVFLTGHLEYVLQAFKLKAYDFLPKPVNDEILEQCLLNIYNDYHSVLTETATSEKYIYVKSGANTHRIKNRDIIYIEKIRNKAVIYMSNSNVTCFEALGDLEKRLNDEDFIRCHKSFIANKSFISKINYNSNEIVFETGHTCFIGRTYKKNLTKLLVTENNRMVIQQ